MPITECIYDCINEKISAREAVEILMGRDKKNEMHIV
jgi:glycerol-3-phosphate dehydrogenase (NAD(P)+)